MQKKLGTAQLAKAKLNRLMDESKLMNVKFLQKCWDLANDRKLEPIDRDLKDYWVTIMWVKGVIRALNWAGYEIRKKE